MTNIYIWDGPGGHIAAAGNKWKDGDWVWTPTKNEFRPPETSRIISAVSEVWGIDRRRLLSDDRAQEVATARHACCLLLKQRMNLGYSAIARIMKRKDHSTILHACRRAQELLKGDTVFQARYVAALSNLGIMPKVSAWPASMCQPIPGRHMNANSN